MRTQWGLSDEKWPNWTTEQRSHNHTITKYTKYIPFWNRVLVMTLVCKWIRAILLQAVLRVRCDEAKSCGRQVNRGRLRRRRRNTGHSDQIKSCADGALSERGVGARRSEAVCHFGASYTRTLGEHKQTVAEIRSDLKRSAGYLKPNKRTKIHRNLGSLSFWIFNNRKLE